MRRELLLAVFVVGCSAKSNSAKTEKPATVAHPAGETEQAVITLTAEAEKRIALATAKIETGSVRKTRVVPGEVVVPSGGAIALVAPFAATVRPLAGKLSIPRIGDAVARDEKLLRLVPLAPADRDVRAQAQKAVTVAEARLQAAEQRLTRLEKLLSEGAASQKQIEEAKADKDAMSAELAAAKQRLNTIETSPLSADVSVVLTAPHDGVVRLSPVVPGQLVAAGAPLLEIVKKSGFWVRAIVYAGDVASIHAESPARVASLGAAPNAAVDANPIAAPPSADPAASTVDFFYELPATIVRKPGERVTVTLELNGEEQAVTLPWSAVVFDAAGGAWVYEKAGPSRYARRRVDVARVDGDRAVVTRSPAVGAEVVSTGAAELFGVEFGAGH